MKKISKLLMAVMSAAFIFVALSPVATAWADPTPTPAGTGIVDYMGDSGHGTFDQIQDTVEPVLADAYALLMKLGIGALAIAGLVAAICFGLFKDSQTIREHKQWLVRIIIAVVIVGSILALIGIISKVRIV